MEQQIAIEYKKKIASRYLPVRHEEITNKIIKSDGYNVSIKYDGHFYILYCNNNNVKLINPGGNIIEDLPLITEFKNNLKQKCKSVILAGELYFYKDGDRSRSFELIANLKKNPQKIYFAVFDIIQLNGTDFEGDIKSKYEKLDMLLSDCTKIHSINTNYFNSRKDIQDFYQKIVTENNSEGIVVKVDNGPTYKIKPLITIDAVILGYVEGGNDKIGLLKELLVGLCIRPNEFIVLTRIVNGYSDEERKNLLTKLKDEKVESNYIEVSGSNLAFTMIRPTKIVEFSCLDIFTENSKGIISKMVLKYEKDQYLSIEKQPLVSLSSAVYMRIRDDKNVNTDDVGISQLEKIISIQQEKKTSEPLEKSKIISREVYIKESKGEKMVRKFIIWKSNKENSGKFPAYIYHYTDFSPNRAERIKQEIKVSSSEKQIETFFNLGKEQNIKKGWVKIDK